MDVSKTQRSLSRPDGTVRAEKKTLTMTYQMFEFKHNNLNVEINSNFYAEVD